MIKRGNTTTRRKFGIEGEDVAVQFLQQQGYQILERNYYYHHGEIDLVVKESETLVFIEVKTRRTAQFGEPEESVTPKKQELLRRTAEGYVRQRNISEISCRFDVVSVVIKDGRATCRLFKDCF